MSREQRDAEQSVRAAINLLGLRAVVGMLLEHAADMQKWSHADKHSRRNWSGVYSRLLKLSDFIKVP